MAKQQNRGPRYWVNDKTRRCQVTMGSGPAKEAEGEGFREVTSEEMTNFQAETRNSIGLPKAKWGRL